VTDDGIDGMTLMGSINKQGRDGNAAADDETPDIDGNDGMTLMGTGRDVIAVIRDSYLHHI
jgi:hypothetical protein